jgi:hypothetical protein
VLFGIANNAASHSILAASRDGLGNSITVKAKKEVPMPKMIKMKTKKVMKKTKTSLNKTMVTMAEFVSMKSSLKKLQMMHRKLK